MKFKENLEGIDIIKKSADTALFDAAALEILSILDKTREDFWNVDNESANFLSLLIKTKGAKNALEIGTSNGYSAIWLANALKETGGKLTTIEFWDNRLNVAIENFKKAGKEDQILLLEGDAADILKKLEPPFDFIFMDAAKGQYIHFLPDILSLMPKGGILVSDNVLQDGDVMESRFAVTRRDRTIHSRMRDYLYELKQNKQLCTDILPVGDGVTISVKL